MKLTDKQRSTVISAIRTAKEQVVAARKRDADDFSAKWNDAREERARRLDAERDELDELIRVLSAKSGALEWP